MSRPFDYHRLVVGYHGCDRSIGEGVLLRGASLKPSSNRYDWLGKSIYFWEHGPERAWEFADWKRKRGEIRDPFVVGAYVHLGRCFDLTDTFATSQLSAFYESLVAAMAVANKPMPRNRSAGGSDFDLVLRDLDCAVLNWGLDGLEREQDVRYDTVRGVFPEGEAAFPGAKILVKTHVQIAVRAPECIVGYFRPTR